MTTTVTVRDANQSFARCVPAVEAGEVFVVTRNSKPVARLSPLSTRRVLTPEQQEAWEFLRQTMQSGLTGTVEPIDRDALHER